MTDMEIEIGILINSNGLQEWERRALETLVQRTSTSVELVVINEESTTNSFRNRIWQVLSAPSLWKFYSGLRILSRKLSGPAELRRRTCINNVDFLRDTRTLRCDPIPADGLGNELPEKVVQEMGELDLIIRFGFGIVVGDALNAPKHGILSFHHGDLREYRGGPFGFWEFFHNKNTAGITLQRINDSLDGGEIIVLSEIDISSASSWTDVRVQLLSHSTDMLAEGVPKAVNSDFSASTSKKLGDLYTSPGNIDMLKLLVRRILR